MQSLKKIHAWAQMKVPLCAPWHYKYWTVDTSGNNNHNKLILFQRQRRQEYIKCKVTSLYLEIKASSCFHSVFLKAIACTIT